jgi:hypothetical protein
LGEKTATVFVVGLIALVGASGGAKSKSATSDVPHESSLSGTAPAQLDTGDPLRHGEAAGACVAGCSVWRFGGGSPPDVRTPFTVPFCHANPGMTLAGFARHNATPNFGGSPCVG